MFGAVFKALVRTRISEIAIKRRQRALIIKEYYIIFVGTTQMTHAQWTNLANKKPERSYTITSTMLVGSAHCKFCV